MTRQELLSTTRLRLNPNIRTSKAHPLRVLLQAPAAPRLLVVTSAEAGILTDFFAAPARVPAVLVALLGKGRCPPLREFYELILQSCDAGVLIPDTVEPEVAPARSWPVRFPARWSGRIATAAFVGGVAALPFGSWRVPNGPLEWIGSLLAACGLLSLGQLGAGAALAGSGGEIRFARLQWKTLLPHFQVSVAGAVMGGPEAEMAVAAIRAAPMALGAAAAAWWQPGLLFVVHLGLLYLLAPWGGSAAMQWLRGRFGAPRLSVVSGRLLESREENSPAASRTHETELGRKGVAARGLWVLLWIAWIMAATGRIFPGFVVRAVPSADRWLRQGTQGLVLLSVIAALILLGLVGLAMTAVQRWRARRRWQTPLGEKQSLLMRPEPLGGATVVETLKQYVVLQSLSDDDLSALAEAVQRIEFAAGATVFEEDGPGDAFYFVVEGSLEISKRLPGRLSRSRVIGELGAGDSFGEIALLENAPRTATIRALRPSRVLRLSRDDFDRLLTRRVGAQKLREVLQNTAFLGRLVHFAGWGFDDLSRFARRCSPIRFESGATVLRKGAPNELFHLVYDGVFEMRDGKKVQRRLIPGDYFGENSLLEIGPGAGDTVAVDYFDARNALEPGVATSDIVAVEEGRCLTMHRTDFLNFFAHDFRVSIRMASRATR